MCSHDQCKNKKNKHLLNVKVTNKIPIIHDKPVVIFSVNNYMYKRGINSYTE